MLLTQCLAKTNEEDFGTSRLELWVDEEEPKPRLHDGSTSEVKLP
jgi:hypothetical protein